MPPRLIPSRHSIVSPHMPYKDCRTSLASDPSRRPQTEERPRHELTLRFWIWHQFGHLANQVVRSQLQRHSAGVRQCSRMHVWQGFRALDVVRARAPRSAGVRPGWHHIWHQIGVPAAIRVPVNQPPISARSLLPMLNQTRKPHYLARSRGSWQASQDPISLKAPPMILNRPTPPWPASETSAT